MTKQEILNQIKQNLKQINQNISTGKIRFPKNMGFCIEGKTLKIKLSSKGLLGNMQENCAAFEGWAFCIKSLLPDLVMKVELIWNKDDKSIRDAKPTEKLHYERFRYRVWKFMLNYDWAVTFSDSFGNYNTNEWVLNYPDGDAKIDPHDKEARLEWDYVEKKKAEYDNVIDHQLPVGVFTGVKSKYTTILPRSHSQIDIWAIKGKEIRIFELKTEDNHKIGIISELMFYVNLMNDLVNKKVKYPDGADTCKYRSFNELYSRLINGQIKKVTGCFLANKLHPLILEDRITKLLNDSSSNIHYSFQRITL